MAEISFRKVPATLLKVNSNTDILLEFCEMFRAAILQKTCMQGAKQRQKVLRKVFVLKIKTEILDQQKKFAQ